MSDGSQTADSLPLVDRMGVGIQGAWGRDEDSRQTDGGSVLREEASMPHLKGLLQEVM